MSYKLLTRGVQRLSDGAFIPDDPRNHDWRDYQAWLRTGQIPAPMDALPPSGKDPLTDLQERIAILEAKNVK